jgi:hypothetical protein
MERLFQKEFNFWTYSKKVQVVELLHPRVNKPFTTNIVKFYEYYTPKKQTPFYKS